MDINIRFYCIALGFEKNMKIQPKLLQDTFIDNLQSALNGNKRKLKKHLIIFGSCCQRKKEKRLFETA